MPHFTEAQPLRPHHLAGIWKLLGERGLVESDDFDAAFTGMSSTMLYDVAAKMVQTKVC